MPAPVYWTSCRFLFPEAGPEGLDVEAGEVRAALGDARAQHERRGSGVGGVGRVPARQAAVEPVARRLRPGAVGTGRRRRHQPGEALRLVAPGRRRALRDEGQVGELAGRVVGGRGRAHRHPEALGGRAGGVLRPHRDRRRRQKRRGRDRDEPRAGVDRDPGRRRCERIAEIRAAEGRLGRYGPDAAPLLIAHVRQRPDRRRRRHRATVTLKLGVAAPEAFCARTVTVAAARSAVVGIETSPEPALIVTPAGAASRA